jgi:hypothetical protein
MIVIYLLAGFGAYKAIRDLAHWWRENRTGPSLFTPGIYTRLRSMT